MHPSDIFQPIFKVTNNTNGLLTRGTYQISGDADLPFPTGGQGWTVVVGGQDDCIQAGSDVSGGTVALAAGGCCFFSVKWLGNLLPAGKYTAKLSFTFGSKKSSETMIATLVRP